MVIIKRRDGTGWSWYVQHHKYRTGSDGSIYLNSTATGDDDATHYNDTAPTNSLITVGTSNGINQNDGTYVMYAFAPVVGYSRFGLYGANGSSDGSYVNLGFRPAFVMLKNISNSGGDGWVMVDDTRFGVGTTQTINPVLSFLVANSNAAEFDSTSYPMVDLLSNGFKLRIGGSSSAIAISMNRASGDSYIYMAFAHSPFKYANAY